MDISRSSNYWFEFIIKFEIKLNYNWSWKIALLLIYETIRRKTHWNTWSKTNPRPLPNFRIFCIRKNCPLSNPTPQLRSTNQKLLQNLFRCIGYKSRIPSIPWKSLKCIELQWKFLCKGRPKSNQDEIPSHRQIMGNTTSVKCDESLDFDEIRQYHFAWRRNENLCDWWKWTYRKRSRILWT